MVDEIHLLNHQVFYPLKFTLSNLSKDLECEEYLGFNFELNKLKIKFRKSKITPKKAGQFVTLWHRNCQGITSPFHTKSDFDFCIIYANNEDNAGFFLFSKSILAKNKIISTDFTEGKRGFRVYPSWDNILNTQAKKTQNWQLPHFYELKNFDSDKFYSKLCL